MIGKDIKALRQEYLLTQQELANELGIGVNTVRRWEGGICEISIRNARKVKDFISKKGKPE